LKKNIIDFCLQTLGLFGLRKLLAIFYVKVARFVWIWSIMKPYVRKTRHPGPEARKKLLFLKKNIDFCLQI
jgi:hypothetical protein